MKNRRNIVAELVAGGNSISRAFSALGARVDSLRFHLRTAGRANAETAESGRGARTRVPHAPWSRRNDATLRLYRQGVCSSAHSWAVKGGVPVLVWLALLLPPGPALGSTTDEYALRKTLQHLNNPPLGAVDTEYAVAIWGNRMIVGAPSDDSLGEDAGIAYVYERNTSDGNWQPLGGGIHPPAGVARPGARRQFGAVVAIWADRIAVAARGLEVVCLYRWQNGQWVSDGVLSLPAIGLGFGEALALEGDRLLVGVPADVSDAERSGRAYLYQRNAAVNPPRWEFEKLFEPPVRTRFAHFGCSVSLSGDRAAIGQRGEAGVESGDVFVFRRAANQTWSPEGSLPHVRENFDYYGQVMTIQGTRAMAGQRQVRPGGKSAIFYAFQNGRWQETASFSDQFHAQSISLGANGRAAAVEVDHNQTRVVTYKLDGNDWVNSADFTTPVTGYAGSFVVHYASAVAVENNTLIVAGPCSQENDLAVKDMAYIYDLRTEDRYTAVNLIGRKTADWFAAVKGAPINYWIDVAWDARVPMNMRHVRVELWDVRNMTSLVCRDLGSNAQNRDSASGGYTPTDGNMPHRFVVTQSNAGTWPAQLPGPTVTVRYRYLWGSQY